MIAIEAVNGVSLLRMEHGKVNALDVELLEALTVAMADFGRSGTCAVVLTGTGRAFSAGVDLHRVLEGGADYAGRLIASLDRAFEAVFDAPFPVVAAVNGPAIAGGCILACACDLRLAASGARSIGAPELTVGVPFPASAVEILRHAGGPRADALVLTGRLHDAEGACEIGIVDEVVPADELVDRACAAASVLGSVPPEVYRLTKRQLRGPAMARIEADRVRTAALVSEIWSSEATHASIRRHLERSIGRG